MRDVGSDRLSWFMEQRLRVEHDLYITRGKFYPIGWAHMKWRSPYRIVGKYPDKPVPPWENRR